MKKHSVRYDGKRLSMWLHDSVMTAKGYLPDFISMDIEKSGTFFEKGLLDLWKEKFKSGIHFVDIGANIGNHSVFAQHFLDAEVVAFEPSPTNAAVLRENIGDECVHMVGLSSREGEMRLEENFAIIRESNTFISNSGGTILREGRGIPVKTLDSFGLEKIDLIKIDVEGMEADVIRGATITLVLNRPHVYTEANTIESAIEQISLMNTLGYSCTNAFNFGNPGLEFTPNEKR